MANLLAISLADVLYRRVGNLLALSCLLWGVFAHAVAFGFYSALGALLMGLLGFGLALPLYAFGKVGAADVKLFGALCSCAGFICFGPFVLYTSLTAGLMGLAQMLVTKKLRRPGDIALWVLGEPDALVRARQTKATLPLAVALSLGLVLALGQRGSL